MTKTTIVNMAKNERLFSLGVGAIMLIYGLIRSSVEVLVLVAAGAFFLYRGLRGYCPGYEWLGINRAVEEEHRARQEVGRAQTFQNVPPRSVQESDRVTEASWESFPTSDPPSWTLGREE